VGDRYPYRDRYFVGQLGKLRADGIGAF